MGLLWGHPSIFPERRMTSRELWSSSGQPRMVGSFSGGGAANLREGGPIFFSNVKNQEFKREQGGQHFSRWVPAPLGPPDATGLPLGSPFNIFATLLDCNVQSNLGIDLVTYLTY